MTIDNVAALASPIYNPNISLQTMAIYNQFDPPSQEVFDQYKQMYMNLPTTNPFMGVISNPVLCDINQAQLNLSQLNAINNNGAGDFSNDSSPTDPQLQNSLDTIDNALSDYQDQTNRVIANLPNILSSIQLALGIANALLCGKSPCQNLKNFLKSLMQDGRNLINSLNAELQNLQNLPKALLVGAIAGAVAIANTLSNMVTNEVNQFVNAMISAARLGLAETLAGLGLDPCLAGLLPSLGLSMPAFNFATAPMNMPNFQFPNPCG